MPPAQQKPSVINDEMIAMRLFEADSTASFRLLRVAFLKLHNRLKVKMAVDALFQAYAEKGIQRGGLAAR